MQCVVLHCVVGGGGGVIVAVSTMLQLGSNYCHEFATLKWLVVIRNITNASYNLFTSYSLENRNWFRIFKV